MKKMKKFLEIMLAMVMAVTMLAGCGGSSKESSSSDNGKTLKFGCFSYSESLDPANMINSAWCSSRYGIGECLFKYKDDLSVENTICDEYSTEDNKTWVFHIRDGVKFSNGNDVTPSAIKACWDVLYANKTGSSNPSKFMDYESITPDDDARTLTIVLKQAKADLRKDLAYPVFVILDVSGDYDLAENPIGTGPYALTSFDSKTKATLVKNKYYWNGEVPYDNVEIDFLSEDNKALALQNGDINLVENVTSTSDLDTLKKDDNFNVSIGQGVRTGFAYINEKGILGDDTLRQAVQMALDHKTMCEVTVGGLYTEGISVLPSSLAYGYDNLKNPYTYNVDNAKKLLDDAEYKDTDGDGIREMNGKKISINYITYENRRLSDFAQAIQTQLADIGIEAKINSMDADREWNKMVAGEYDLCDSNWITVGNGDPTEYMANWYGKSDANFCNYKNAEYDKLYEQLDTEFDEAKRAKIIEQLQQILINDAAVIVHGYYNSSMISDKTVSGANIHTADYYWLTTEIAPAK